MNKKTRENIERWMNERFAIALDTDERLHRDDRAFDPKNVEYAYYRGICDTLVRMGYCWERIPRKRELKEFAHFIEKEV